MAFIGKNPKWNTSTFSPQSTEPANPVEGMTYYDDGTNRPEGLYVYKNSVWTQAGGDAGIRNFDSKGDADIALTSDFTTSGLTLSLSTTAADLIDGQQVFKAVASAASQTVESNSGNIPVPQGFRGRTLKINLQYKGNSSDWNLTIKDKTNTANLVSRVIGAAGGVNNVAKNLSVIFYCPTDCQQLSYQWSSTAADTIIWDEVIVNDDPSFETNTINTEYTFVSQGGSSLTNRSGEIEFNLGTASITSSGDNLITRSDDSGNTRTKFIANKTCIVNLSLSLTSSGGGNFIIVYKNGSVIAEGNQEGTAGFRLGFSTTLELEKDDFFTVGTNGDVDNSASSVRLNYTAIAKQDTVTEFTTDVENMFSARIQNNGSASITSQSAPFIASVNRTGTGSVDVTFVSGFFSEVPAIIVSSDANNFTGYNTLSTSGVSFTNYTNAADPVLDDADFSFTAIRQSSDYRDPTRAIIRPSTLIGYARDVKPTGTNGGTFTSGSWQTRTLNTLEGDTSFMSLSSNQITLDPGTYEISASAPAYTVDGHQIRLRNITDGVTTRSGTVMDSGSSDGTTSVSTLMTKFEITSQKIFEIQHRCGNTAASIGFGVGRNFGEDLVFTDVKIEKIL